MTAPVLQFPSRLDSLLAIIAETRAAVESAWLSHYEAVMELQESKLWKEKATTWDAFLSLPENEGIFFAASTYRQKALDIAIARMIVEIVANAAPTETQSRLVRERLNKLSHDKELKAQTYAKAYEATKSIVPSAAELEIAFYHVQREKAYGVVTLDGEDYDIRNAALDMAIAEEIKEKNERQKGHIDNSLGLTSKRLEILDFGAIEAVFKALGASVPDSIQSLAIVWKEKE